MPTAWAKNNKGNSAKGSALKIARRAVKAAYFATANIGHLDDASDNQTLKFEPVTSTTVGQDLYVVVETENLRDKKLNVNILQGVEKVLAENDSPVSLLVDGAESSKLEGVVGSLANEESYTNAEELKDLAVFKVTMKPESEESLKDWSEQIKNSSEFEAKLYLSVDAHTNNDLSKTAIEYQGYASENSDTASNFLNEKNEYVVVVEADHTCEYCDDEITSVQIEKTIKGTDSDIKITKKQKAIISKVLPYINKYRKDFGLDTCLRKAHFIAQVAHETAFATLEEGEKWSYWNADKGKPRSLPGKIITNDVIVFDATMGASLLDHLNDIFEFKDKDDNVLTKKVTDIRKVLIAEQVKVVDKKLYTYYRRGTELLHTVKEKVKDKDGKEVEQVKYKIYLKNHDHFGMALLSRMYANNKNLSNGNELSQDGWKFKGRGLKQVTGRFNYGKFSKYRKRSDVVFPGDSSGYIDFTANNDKCDPQDIKKGEYLKLLDPMYAVQSALWFWNEGTKHNGMYSIGNADKDDVEGVSKAINSGDSKGLEKRKVKYSYARVAGAFDIVRHYIDIYDNGSKAQKTEAKTYFAKWKDLDTKAKEKHDAILKKEKEKVDEKK